MHACIHKYIYTYYIYIYHIIHIYIFDLIVGFVRKCGIPSKWQFNGQNNDSPMDKPKLQTQISPL
jgi:hypothetical protein